MSKSEKMAKALGWLLAFGLCQMLYVSAIGTFLKVEAAWFSTFVQITLWTWSVIIVIGMVRSAFNRRRFRMQRSMTLFHNGDLTLVWEEDQDEQMLAFVEAKMAEGVQFFIIEPRALGLLPPKKTKLTDAQLALKNRSLAVADVDLSSLLAAGVAAVPTPNSPAKTVKRAKTAKEVVENNTLGVKQQKGG